MISPSILLALTWLALTSLPGGEAQLNQCFPTSTAGVDYACVSNTFIAPCTGSVITSNVIPFNCKDTPGAGGSDSKTFCYPRMSTLLEACREPPPACTQEGSFPVPGTLACSHYYNCAKNANGFNQFLLACPVGQNFQRASQRCTSDPCSTAVITSTTVPPSLTGSCIPLTRQEDPNNCRNFYQCSILGQLKQTKCPFNKLYDSALKICTFIANCGSRPNN